MASSSSRALVRSRPDAFVCASRAEERQKLRCRSVCGDEHIQAPGRECDFFEFDNTLERSGSDSLSAEIAETAEPRNCRLTGCGRTNQFDRHSPRLLNAPNRCENERPAKKHFSVNARSVPLSGGSAIVNAVRWRRCWGAYPQVLSEYVLLCGNIPDSCERARFGCISFCSSPFSETRRCGGR